MIFAGNFDVFPFDPEMGVIPIRMSVGLKEQPFGGTFKKAGHFSIV